MALVFFVGYSSCSLEVLASIVHCLLAGLAVCILFGFLTFIPLAIKPPTLAIFSNTVILFTPTASLAVTQIRFLIPCDCFHSCACLTPPMVAF
jgi:hypothetical protein